MAPVIRVVERLIAPLRRRVLAMIGRAVVRLVDDGPPRQRMQVEVLAGEVLDEVERMQQYGLSSCPPPGSDAIVLALGGMRQHPVVIAAEYPPTRPNRAECGDVSLYTWRDDRRERGVARHTIYLSGTDARMIRLMSRSEAGATARCTLRSGPAASIVQEIRAAGAGVSVSAEIGMTPAAITLRCGRSSITLTDAGITVRTPAWAWEQAS